MALECLTDSMGILNNIFEGFYEVPCYVCGTKEELAHAMGKEVRASLAVTDEGFADAIINLLN